jgi:hypothetical protein
MFRLILGHIYLLVSHFVRSRVRFLLIVRVLSLVSPPRGLLRILPLPSSFLRLLRRILHLLTAHNVGGLDIQPCPFDEVFVCFNSSLKRRWFLDGPALEFDDYTATFEKHDKGDNAREFDLDSEVWLLLVGYPLDVRTISAIVKVVSGFAMLRHVHESGVLSRIMIKVCMNSETQVPPSVVVRDGEGARIRTWTIPIFILSISSKATLGDEDSYLLTGPPHPLPPSVAPWMGPEWDHPLVGESQVQDNVTPHTAGSGGHGG